MLGLLCLQVVLTHFHVMSGLTILRLLRWHFWLRHDSREWWEYWGLIEWCLKVLIPRLEALFEPCPNTEHLPVTMIVPSLPIFIGSFLLSTFIALSLLPSLATALPRIIQLIRLLLLLWVIDTGVINTTVFGLYLIIYFYVIIGEVAFVVIWVKILLI